MGREGIEVYLNRIIEELFPPQSCFSATLLLCVLYNLYEWYNFGFDFFTFLPYTSLVYIKICLSVHHIYIPQSFAAFYAAPMITGPQLQTALTEHRSMCR